MVGGDDEASGVFLSPFQGLAGFGVCDPGLTPWATTLHPFGVCMWLLAGRMEWADGLLTASLAVGALR